MGPLKFQHFCPYCLRETRIIFKEKIAYLFRIPRSRWNFRQLVTLRVCVANLTTSDREGERTQPGYKLNQGINLTRHQLNQGTNSTKERTQPGYELNQSGNELNQYKI